MPITASQPCFFSIEVYKTSHIAALRDILFSKFNVIMVQAHEKICNKTCVTSEDIRAVLPEFSLITCVFFSYQASKRGINENPCHTG